MSEQTKHAAHTALPWRTGVGRLINSAIRSPQGYIVADCGISTLSQGAVDASFIVQAANAHDKLVEALKAVDAHWFDDFPSGPVDGSRLRPEPGDVSMTQLCPSTIRLWRQVRAALTLAGEP